MSNPNTPTLETLAARIKQLEENQRMLLELLEARADLLALDAVRQRVEALEASVGGIRPT